MLRRYCYTRACTNLPKILRRMLAIILHYTGAAFFLTWFILDDKAIMMYVIYCCSAIGFCLVMYVLFLIYVFNLCMYYVFMYVYLCIIYVFMYNLGIIPSSRYFNITVYFMKYEIMLWIIAHIFLLRFL